MQPRHALIGVTAPAEELAATPTDAGDAVVKSRRRRATGGGWVVALAAGVYLLVACLLYWPIPPWDNSHVLGQANGDPAQTVWFLQWVAWAIAHGHNPFFTNYVDYPIGANLATNTSVPLLGILGAPITWLFGSITTANMLMRLALAGSAFTMFLVLRRWVRWWPAALIGGGLFAFNSITLQHSRTHLHLVFLVVPPLILWVLDELFVVQRRRPVVLGLVLGLLTMAQWLINDEVLFGCALFSVIGLAILGIANRGRAMDHLRWALPGVGTATVVFGVLVAYPLWSLLAGPQHLIGPTQPRWLIAGYKEDLLGPFVPYITEATRAPASVIARYHPSRPVSSFQSIPGYMGWPLFLLLIGLATAWRRNRRIRFASLMAAIAFGLSLGGTMSVLGHDTGIPLPAAVFSHVPLLYEVLPERLTIFMWMFLAVVLAVGLECSYRWLCTRAAAAPSPAHRARRARSGLPSSRAKKGALPPLMVVLGVAAVVAATFAPMFVTAEPRLESPVPKAAAATMVPRHTPRGGVVLYLPFTRSFAAQPMIWQAQSNMAYRTVSGYVIIPGTSYSSRNWPHPPKDLGIVLAAIPAVSPIIRPTRHLDDTMAYKACRELPHVIRHYDLDSIVVWHPPLTTISYGLKALSAALGPAPLHQGGLVMWDHVAGRERGVAACTTLAPS